MRQSESRAASERCHVRFSVFARTKDLALENPAFISPPDPDAHAAQKNDGRDAPFSFRGATYSFTDMNLFKLFEPAHDPVHTVGTTGQSGDLFNYRAQSLGKYPVTGKLAPVSSS